MGKIITNNSSQIAGIDLIKYKNIIKSSGTTLNSSNLDSLYEFLKGVYSNIGRVEVYIFQDGYNAGTGPTAFSTYGNAITLVNSPEWVEEGISFAASNSYGTLRNPNKSTSLPGCSIFTVCRTANPRGHSNAEVIFGGVGIGGSQLGPFISVNGTLFYNNIENRVGFAVSQDGANVPNGIFLDSAAAQLGKQHALCGSYDLSQSKIWVAREGRTTLNPQTTNGSITGVWNDNANWRFAARLPDHNYDFKGNISLAIPIWRGISQSEWESLLNLYISTVGINSEIASIF